MTTPAPSTDFPRNRRKWPRWVWPVLFVMAGTATLFTAVMALGDDRTKVIFAWAMIVPPTILAVVLWWLLASGYRWRTRLTGIAGGAIAGLLFLTVFRFDGFNGDMVPRFSLRGRISPEDAARAEERSRSASVLSEETPATRRLTVRPDDWPGYGGLNRDSTTETSLDGIVWTDDAPPKLMWSRPVGLGWSSFAVVDGRLFTQAQVDGEERVLCLDLATGEPIWTHADPVRFSEALGGDGPRATPTFTGGKLVTLGATGLLNCLDAATGKKLWQTNILTDAAAGNLSWGMAGSPLVVEGLVVVNPGGTDGKSVIAYDLETGARRWSAGNEKASYCAPRLATLDGVEQILVFHAHGLTSYAPETGTPLWQFPWENGSLVNAAEPIPLDGKRVFLSCGYSQGSACLDVSAAGQRWDARKLWTTNRYRLKFSDGIPDNGFIYGLDENRLACLDLATGKLTWKGPVFGYGQLLRAGNTLLVLAENGEVALVEFDPKKFRERCRFRALPDATTWAHPVIAERCLIVKNNEALRCYQLSESPKPFPTEPAR